MHEKYYIFLSHRLYTQEVQTSNYSDTNHRYFQETPL